MELVAGTPITEASALPSARRSTPAVWRVCSAVHYAHQQLILHRDLKPANIVVTGDGMVKVLDFGIARILREDADASVGATTMAHPLSYGCASPEQLRGEPLSLASDIYALGVLLYELATGVNPQYRAGATFEETFRRVVDETPLAPSRVAHTLPRDLDAIVMKAIAKLPAGALPVGRRAARRHRTAAIGPAGAGADAERRLRLRPFRAPEPARCPRWPHCSSSRRRRESARIFIRRGSRGAPRPSRAGSGDGQQVSTFLTRLFGASDPNAQATTTLRDLLDRAAARIEPDLKDQPRAQANLLATIGHVYRSLGLHKEAVDLSEKGRWRSSQGWAADGSIRPKRR